MGIISCERGFYTNKCINLNIKKGKVVVKSITEDIPVKVSYLSYPEPDLEIDTVYLPPLKDRKTKEIIIRKKLGIKDKSTVISFLEDKDVKQDNQTLHYVYSVKLKDKLPLKNVEVLTFSQISLFNFSKQIKEGKFIYHCFADEEKIIITLSKGDTLIYARIVEIPDVERKDPINFYYETINLTYHFVLQNKAKKIDLIILSGNMFESLELSRLVYSFSNSPVASINFKYFTDLDEPEIFHKMIIPIGNVYTDDNFNFLPEDLKEEKAFNKLTLLSQAVLVIAVFILFGGVFFNVKKIDENINIINSLSKKIVTQKKLILRKSDIDIKDLSFYEMYIQHIIRSESTNPFYILSEFEPLLKLLSPRNITIKEDEENYYITVDINEEKTFSTFSELNKFKEDFDLIISKLSSNYTVDNQSKFDFSNLKVFIKIHIERSI